MVYIIQMKGIEGYCPESHGTHTPVERRENIVSVTGQSCYCSLLSSDIKQRAKIEEA